MKLRYIIITSLIVICSLISKAQYHIQRNTAYFEFLGVAEFYSINIDHIINEFHHNSETVRFGVSYRPKNSFYITSGLNLMHGLKKQKDRYIEIGFGVTYKNEYTKGKNTGTKFKFIEKSDTFGYLSVGYRKQGTKREPLFWKVAFTPLLFRDLGKAIKGSDVSWLGYFMPSVGVSVGYSF